MSAKKEPILIASDHYGLTLKNPIRDYLIEKGYEVLDLGMQREDEPQKFYEIAPLVAKAIQNKEVERGILMCGTGMGVSLCANKFKGVYAAVAESATTAELHYVINRANVLCMGERVTGPGVAMEIVRTWLSTPFGGGRHQRRIELFS